MYVIPWDEPPCTRTVPTSTFTCRLRAPASDPFTTPTQLFPSFCTEPCWAKQILTSTVTSSPNLAMFLMFVDDFFPLLPNSSPATAPLTCALALGCSGSHPFVPAVAARLSRCCRRALAQANAVLRSALRDWNPTSAIPALHRAPAHHPSRMSPGHPVLSVAHPYSSRTAARKSKLRGRGCRWVVG